MDNSIKYFSSSWIMSEIFLMWAALFVISFHQADARAFFVFGDSLVDSGNNDFIATTARADNYPYGIDYPTHLPSGRFSNGYNLPDIISQRMGMAQSPLPYLNPRLTEQQLLNGANFASAGIGILNDTGVQFVNIVHIGQQLAYFEEYLKRLVLFLGQEQAQRIVNQALVLITLGGNDFVNNYYLVPYSVRSRQYALPDYVPMLIFEYHKILRRLYDLGARRVLVTGTGPLGCVPAELALHSTNGECIDNLQEAASLFNPQLEQLISQINRELRQDVFIAVNVHAMHFNFISNPRAFGFTTSKIACCGQGPYNGVGLCTPASLLCPNRDEYVFWDGFHPCERANKLIVEMMMNGSTKFMNPMNLSTVMELDEYSRI